MYERRYGLIRTLAPLHVGASAGEEAGNLNLIFRDSFTQTGIIPGSSIRGRFRAEMRRLDTSKNRRNTDYWYGNAGEEDGEDGDATQEDSAASTDFREEEQDQSPRFSESRVKFEYASLLWIPVFCPGQPVVWVSCPRLLRRHARVAGLDVDNHLLKGLANSGSQSLAGADVSIDTGADTVKLFFNLGFLSLNRASEAMQLLLEKFAPKIFRDEIDVNQLVIVDDASIGAIHDMALYRQSRVKLKDDEKLVQFYFNVEALPEGSVLSFPIAINRSSVPAQYGTWAPINATTQDSSGEMYFGGLESIGFGRCQVAIQEVGQ